MIEKKHQLLPFTEKLLSTVMILKSFHFLTISGCWSKNNEQRNSVLPPSVGSGSVNRSLMT